MKLGEEPRQRSVRSEANQPCKGKTTKKIRRKVTEKRRMIRKGSNGKSPWATSSKNNVKSRYHFWNRGRELLKGDQTGEN